MSTSMSPPPLPDAASIITKLKAAARREAARKVRDSVGSPDGYDRLDQLYDSAVRGRNEAELQLRGATDSQFISATLALNALAKSREVATNVERSLSGVKQQSAGCRSLISEEEYSVITKLHRTRTNIISTLVEVTRAREIPQKVRAIRVLLTDAGKILEAHSEVLEMEQMRRWATAQAAKHPEMLLPLEHPLADIEHVSKEFEAKLWGIFKSARELSADQPWVLVRANQVIEREELLDRSRDEGKKALAARCRDVLLQSIDERFATALTTLDGTKCPGPQVLAETFNLLLGDLTDVLDKAAPCFHPRHDVFNLFATAYHQRFFDVIRGLGAKYETGLPNSAILEVLRWVHQDLERQLARLGLARLQSRMGAALAPLEDMYGRAIKEMMITWAAEIAKASRETGPRLVDGQLVTTFPTDLYGMTNTQISVARKADSATLVTKVAAAVVSALAFYAGVHLTDQMGLGTLIATVNDAHRCCEMAVDLSDSITGCLDAAHAALIDVDPAVRAFRSLADRGTEAIIKLIFIDLRQPLAKLFTPVWPGGRLVETMLLCINEYVTQELEPCMLNTRVRRVCSGILAAFVSGYLDRLLGQKHNPSVLTSPAGTRKLQEDGSAITDYFSQKLRRGLTAQVTSPLGSIKEMLAADGDMIPLYFDAFQKSQPAGALNVLQRVLEYRTDIPKGERNAVLQNCIVWSQQK